jgi:nitroreductase
MNGILKLIQERHSSRVPFNRQRPVTRHNLKLILEAARWAPTAHNMQNYEIIVIDDKTLLRAIGSIKLQTSEEFIRENYKQLSSSRKELLRKKVGILGTAFPPAWRDPRRLDEAVREAKPEPLRETIQGSSMIMIVVYDSRKRAPASEGDVLGMMSLGCLMENMWLMATSLGISFHVMSVFSAPDVEREVKRTLKIPGHMKIAFAVRLGYSKYAPTKYMRVRRDVEDFTHHNCFRIVEDHIDEE